MKEKPGRKPRPLLDRLLSKISTPTDPRPFIGVPVSEWPDRLRLEPWLWTAGRTKETIKKVWNTRPGGWREYFFCVRPPMPCFKHEGQKTARVHALVYKLFLGEPQGPLWYHDGKPNYMDMNPAHWVVREQARCPKLELEAAPEPVVSQEVRELAEYLEEQYLKNPATFLNIAEEIYDKEQIEEALMISGLHRRIHASQSQNPILGQPLPIESLAG